MSLERQNIYQSGIAFFLDNLFISFSSIASRCLRRARFFAMSICYFTALLGAGCTEKTEAVQFDFRTAEVNYGDVQQIVTATGKIIPKNQVVVGSEVSGRITDVFVDYNSIVKKGDILAKIDITDFQNSVKQIESQIESANAEIDIQKSSIEVADATFKNVTLQFERQKELFEREAISAKQFELVKRDVDIAKANLSLAMAQQRSIEARIKQLQSLLDTSKITLSRTTIRSPIDGVVIERKVDPGQTVQASFSTPELFTIAADLSEVNVHAQIVESDVGGLEAGDFALFTVDAYPNLQVTGAVEQLRFNGMEENNIVTYVAVVSANNEEGNLMPGMTASLRITAESRTEVLRLPVGAVRFRPSSEQISTLEKREEVTLENYKVRNMLDPYYQRLENIGINSSRVDEFKVLVSPQTEALQNKIKDPAFAPEHAAAKRSLSDKVDTIIESYLTPEEYANYQNQIALERRRQTVDIWVPVDGNKISRRTVQLGLIDGSYAEVIGGLRQGDKVLTAITQRNDRK